MKSLTTLVTLALLAQAGPLLASEVQPTPAYPSQQTGAVHSPGYKEGVVFSTAGEELGEITEVIKDERSNTIYFVMLTLRGKGVGNKDIAVPLEAFTLDHDNGRKNLTIDEDKLDNSPVQGEKTNQEFQRELADYYGVGSADPSDSRVPDPAPALETGSPQKRDPLNQLE